MPPSASHQDEIDAATPSYHPGYPSASVQNTHFARLVARVIRLASQKLPSLV
jgi:hypothetical protein